MIHKIVLLQKDNFIFPNLSVLNLSTCQSCHVTLIGVLVSKKNPKGSKITEN